MKYATQVSPLAKRKLTPDEEDEMVEGMKRHMTDRQEEAVKLLHDGSEFNMGMVEERKMSKKTKNNLNIMSNQT